VSSALQPVQVGDETLYRLISVRQTIEPIQVETLGTRTPSPSGAPMALVYGRFMNTGQWNEIHAAAEAQFMGLRGSRFMELVSAGAFDRAIADAESGARPRPRLLFQHGQDNVHGTIPIGKITRLLPTGHYEAQLFIDRPAVRDLLPRSGKGSTARATRRPGRSRASCARTRPRARTTRAACPSGGCARSRSSRRSRW
jgi:hypothetical protein